MAVELDGQVHFNPVAQEKDRIRTQHLESLGITVIRFENKMLFENLPAVLEEIRNNFKG